MTSKTVQVSITGELGAGKDRILHAIEYGNGKTELNAPDDILAAIFKNIVGFLTIKCRRLFEAENTKNLEDKNKYEEIYNFLVGRSKEWDPSRWGSSDYKKYANLAKEIILDETPGNWNNLPFNCHDLKDYYYYNIENFVNRNPPFFFDNGVNDNEKAAAIKNMTYTDFLNAYIQTRAANLKTLETPLKMVGTTYGHYKINVKILNEPGASWHRTHFREEHDRNDNDSDIYIFVISATSKTDLQSKLFPKDDENRHSLTHRNFNPNQVIVFISKTEETEESEIEKIKAEVKSYFDEDQRILEATGRKFKNLQDLYVVTAKDLGPAVYSVEYKSKQKNILKNVARHMLNCIGKTLNLDNKETSGVSTAMYNSSQTDSVDENDSVSDKNVFSRMASKIKSGIIDRFGKLRRGFGNLTSRVSRNTTTSGGRRRRSVKRKKPRRSRKSRNI
jgi:hypothetical protein